MITIYGASDDLVELTGCDAAEEFSAIGGDIVLVVGREEASLGENASGITVRMHYGTHAAGGVWEACVSPIDEDAPCPWPVRIKISGYTASVEIDAPRSTPVKARYVEAAR